MNNMAKYFLAFVDGQRVLRRDDPLTHFEIKTIVELYGARFQSVESSGDYTFYHFTKIGRGGVRNESADFT